MLKTPIGNLRIMIDDKDVYYIVKELVNKTNVFSVDSRFRIIVNNNLNLHENSTMQCIIDNKLPIKSCIETGEDLQLISFYSENIKLSIGMEDIAGLYYKYLENGIQIQLSNIISVDNIKINIAWLEMEDKDKEDVFTWYAADPTFY